MLEVMLNPPKKKKAHKGGKKKSAHSKTKARKRPRKVCFPKRELRYATSLKRLKSRILRPGKRICFPKGALKRADSLKKFKHRYLGVKYGFARHKKAAKGAMVQGELVSGPSPKKSKSKKGKAKKAVKYTWKEMFDMSPYERGLHGITDKHLSIANKRGFAMVKPPKESTSTAPEETYDWKEQTSVYGGVPTAANPYRRKYRFNYTVPIYAFNQENSLSALRDGMTAGFRPRVLAQVVPVVGGLVANSIVAGTVSNMVAEKLKLSDTAKGPVKLGIGLLTAGLLSGVTKMVAERYSNQVFLGGLAQVLWDGYQTYLQPLVKKYTGMGCCENGEEPDLTFGLYCPECAAGLGGLIGDFLTPGQVRDARSVVSEMVAPVVPPVEMAMQAPPLTAKVNGQEVIVEKVASQPAGVSGFGDFLTPNQVSQASPLGEFGAL